MRRVLLRGPTLTLVNTISLFHYSIGAVHCTTVSLLFTFNTDICMTHCIETLLSSYQLAWLMFIIPSNRLLLQLTYSLAWPPECSSQTPLRRNPPRQ